MNNINLFISFAHYSGSANFNVFDATQPEDLIWMINPDQKLALLEKSSLRYARYQSFATVLNVLPAFSSTFHQRPEKAGVIAINGPHQLDVADQYAQVLAAKGSRFLNPLQFPYILQSSVPCELAAHYQLKGMALSVGSDQFGFFDALYLSSSLLIKNVMESVLLLSSGVLEPYFQQNDNMSYLALCLTLHIGLKKVSDQRTMILLKIDKDVPYERLTEIAAVYLVEPHNLIEVSTGKDDHDGEVLHSARFAQSPLAFATILMAAIIRTQKHKRKSDQVFILYFGQTTMKNILVFRWYI